jgi:hypothetical protein
MMEGSESAQILSESSSNSQRFNIFRATLGDADAIPLDASGIYSLIRTHKYE